MGAWVRRVLLLQYYYIYDDRITHVIILYIDEVTTILIFQYVPLLQNRCIEKVSSKVKQIFYLIPTTSKDSEDDERHAYFLESILSQVIRLKQKRTLIITPSYLNYVRVRNELIKRDVNAAFVCEYSRESEISRGRSQFFHGVKDVLLYSGRAHFFRRFLLRGTY